ncbi:MAG: hypothetical protein ACO3JL_21935, partial [Myxococcota bacterium]
MWTTHTLSALYKGRFVSLGTARSVLSSSGDEFFVLSLTRAVPYGCRAFWAHLTRDQKEVLEPVGDVHAHRASHSLLQPTPHGFRRYGSATECIDKEGYPYFRVDLSLDVPVDVRQF